MISLETIERALYEWATMVLTPAVKVLYYHENGPRPTSSYVALHLSTVNSIGWDVVDNEGNLTGNRDFTLLCQGVGKLSMDYLEKLKTSLEKPNVQAFLRQRGIVFVERLAIQDITELVDTRWEERNILDLKFRFAQIDNDRSGIFDKVNAQGTVKDIDLHTVAQVNINL